VKKIPPSGTRRLSERAAASFRRRLRHRIATDVSVATGSGAAALGPVRPGLATRRRGYVVDGRPAPGRLSAAQPAAVPRG